LKPQVERRRMVEASPLFKTLAIEPDPPTAPQSQAAANQQAVAIKMIQIALSAIWQQFIIALSHLFTLASGASCFVLWLLTPDPNQHQLISMGMYAAFVLVANVLVLRSRK
jgi:hypothetical protein